jgi:hypothetical protein
MGHLSICAVAGLKVMMEGTWDAWRPYGERARGMVVGEFPAAMDRQIEEFRELFDAIPDEDFTGKLVAHPSGTTISLGLGLIKMPLAWLIAYRMQLFLYAKAAGAVDINTANCWSGIDWKGPEAEVVEQEEGIA